jgi:hypothetical protein
MVKSNIVETLDMLFQMPAEEVNILMHFFSRLKINSDGSQ